MSIRIANVRGLRTPEQRSGVCYVGRAFAGWPASRWGNPYRVGSAHPNGYPGRKLTRDEALDCFVRMVDGWSEAQRSAYLDSLWESCKHGELPLGCWCTTATVGDGSPVVCHAQVLAQLLHDREERK